MASVPDARPRYIEDWVRNYPDAFNSSSPSGDAVATDPVNGDWSQPIMRAMAFGLGLNEASGVSPQRNPPLTILFGQTRDVYFVRRTIPLFSNIVGLWPEVELRFTGPNVEDAIVVHYPDTAPGPGTNHPGNGYALAPGMEAWEGYGSNGWNRVEKLLIRIDTNNVQPRARGLAIFRKARIKELTCFGAPWHGFHVQADVLGGYISNANGTFIDDCFFADCGTVYHTKAWLVDPEINPDGFAGYGWGGIFQGGDSNWCRVRSTDITTCARGGIHERSFLGPNIIDHIHSEQISVNFLRTQIEADREASALAWINANPDPGVGSPGYAEWARRNRIAQETYLACRGWGRAVGTPNRFAIVADGPSARSSVTNTYTEGDGIVRVDGTNIAIGGIVGVDEGNGMRIGVGDRSIVGTWYSAQSRNVYPRVTHGVGPAIPFSIDQPLNSLFGEGFGEFFRLSLNGANARETVAVNLGTGTIDSREIERGRGIVRQAIYFGSTRLNIANGNPATNPPSAIGAFLSHGNGPGDREGDLAIWPAGPKTAGSPWLWICVGNPPSATWQPVLFVPGA